MYYPPDKFHADAVALLERQNRLLERLIDEIVSLNRKLSTKGKIKFKKGKK